MDTSILDRYLLEAISTDSSKKTSTNSASSEMSESFRDFFQQYSSRQKKTLSVLQKTAESLSSRYDNWNENITEKLQKYFSAQENLSTNLRATLNWFSASNGTRQNFMSHLENLTGSYPEGAANSLRGLFRTRENMSQALAGTGMENSLYFSSIRQMSASTYGLSGNAPEGGDVVGDTTFASMNIEISFRQVQIQTAGVSMLQQLEGSDMSAFKGLLTSSSRLTSFNINASLTTSFFSTSTSTSRLDLMMKLLDPLVLDLDGDGIDLKSMADGILFDLKGDGEKVNCGFVQGDDALLFLDEDGDGLCNRGTELFGDQEGDANGFAELAKHDLNNDRVIDENDTVYKDLKVWNDYNGDGECQDGEVRSLSGAGVESISLGYRNTYVENNGNFISQEAFFRRFDGAFRSIVDAQFGYREV